MSNAFILRSCSSSARAKSRRNQRETDRGPSGLRRATWRFPATRPLHQCSAGLRLWADLSEMSDIKNSLELQNSIPVRHASNIVRNSPRSTCLTMFPIQLCNTIPRLRRQHFQIIHEGAEQRTQYTTRFDRHPAHTVMPIQSPHQKSLELSVRYEHIIAEADIRAWRSSHRFDICRGRRRDGFAAIFDQGDDLCIDHAPNDLVNQTTLYYSRPLCFNLRALSPKQRYFIKLL